MTENRYDDELLSTILDGEASEETVAAVRNNAEAQQRLEALRSAVDYVAQPVAEPTPERRAQSIAAAMAAATPASPEVTSLAAARHKKTEAKRSGIPTGWLVAAAAAVIAFIVATPFLFGGGEVADVADAANESADALAADEVVEATESSDDGETAAVASDEEAMEEESAEEEEVVEEAMEDEAMEEESAEGDASDSDDAADSGEEESAEEAPAPVAGLDDGVSLDVQVVPSVSELELAIDNATIAPQLAGADLLALDSLQARSTSELDEVLATEVNPACLEAGVNVTSAAPYAVVVLDPFAGPATLVIVEFGDDGMTRLLDAETCAVIG